MAIDVRSANNALCREWQTIVETYKKFEHPSKPQLNNVVDKAKECLAAFDEIAMLEPEKYVQNTLIYENCMAIENCVLDLACYENKDGEWKKVFSPLKHSDIALPGQKSWKEKRDAHRVAIEDEYKGTHENEQMQIVELQEQAGKIQAQLDELKEEKKSKGFFNFAEKGEVKERMKPVKEELAQVEEQIRLLERLVDTYVDERLTELGKSFTRLKF